MMAVAILLAALGACGYALGARMQHRAVHATTGGARFSLRDQVRLFGEPRWLAGLLVLVAGAGLHVTALGYAPLSVVQPLGVIALPLTVLLTLREQGIRTRELNASVLLSMAAAMAGVGLFVVFAAHAVVPTTVGPQDQLAATQVAAITVLALAMAAVLSRSRMRCVLFAAGGAVAYGYVSLLMRGVTQQLGALDPARLPVIPLFGVVTAVLVGGWLVQHSYASGSPDLVVACLTVIDPIVAVGMGLGLLGEADRTGFATTVGQVACAAVACVGVFALARYHPGTQRHVPVREPVAAAGTAAVPRLARPFSEEHLLTAQTTEGPLRIVVGAVMYPPDVSGAANFGYRLARGLLARGHEVHVICHSDDRRAHTRTEDGVTVHRVPSHGSPFHPTVRFCLPWQATRYAARLLRQIQPDVVHVQSHFFIGRGLINAARRAGIGLVATNHFMPENIFGYLRMPRALHGVAGRLLWRQLVEHYSKTQLVTAPTPRAVQLLHDNGYAAESMPLSCGIDVQRYRSRAVEHRRRDPDPEARTALFVGRIDDEKHIDDLLRATSLLRLPHRTRLEIIGDGAHRPALERLAAELGIAEQVHFAGHVDDEELLDAYARADLFCMPSTAELQSLATMEAMSARTPVVLANAMALPHLVEPGANGWLHPPRDVHALARAIEAVLGDRATIDRMGRASERIVSQHDINAVLGRFESTYRWAVQSAGSAETGEARSELAS